MKRALSAGLFEVDPTGCERFVGYSRVSTDRQASEGISLEAQREAIAQYAADKGLELVLMCSDSTSGTKGRASRPGYDSLLAALASGLACGVVLTSLDRLSRDTIEAITRVRELNDKGFRVICLDYPGVDGVVDTSSSIGSFVLTLTAAVAELIRAQISEKTSAALASKRARGESIGPAPYGYDAIEGRLVPNKAEQRALGYMLSLREGGASYGSIAAQLSDTEFRPKHSDTWYPNAVRLIIERAKARGERGTRAKRKNS